MSHRTVIKVLIVVVIGIVVAWSVVNISDYAHTFHASLVVWTMGAALGTANALSVYAFVMAKTREVQRPAVIGIILFGGMSGTLQTLLYLQVGAPILAALAFGWFGPVAEGVLAWLHAALSDEVVKQGKQTGKQSQANASKQPGQASKQETQPTQATSAQPARQVATVLPASMQEMVALPSRVIASHVGVSRQSVDNWKNDGILEKKIAEKLPELALVGTNGHSGHNGFGAH